MTTELILGNQYIYRDDSNTADYPVLTLTNIVRNDFGTRITLIAEKTATNPRYEFRLAYPVKNLYPA